MVKVTEQEAKEYFVKMTCDAYSKEDLARQIWAYMNADKREPYFKQLYELREDEE